MTNSEGTSLPRDPGPVPASLREAFAWSRNAARSPMPLSAADEAALETLVATRAADDDQFASIEHLLESHDGSLALAHLIAARSATAGTDELLNAADGPPAQASRTFRTNGAARRHAAVSALKPFLLAASLLLVAGTSWYVFTLPPPGDEVRTMGAAVDLQPVPPAAAEAPLTLRWKAISPNARYRVEVLDSTDVPVFVAETSERILTVPRASLKRGVYRWWVRSRGADGADIRSRVEKLVVY